MSTIREILVAQAFEPHRYPHENLRATNTQNMLDYLAHVGQVRTFVTDEEWFSHVHKPLSKTRQKAIDKLIKESIQFGFDIYYAKSSYVCKTKCQHCGQSFRRNINFHFKKGKAYATLPMYCSCIYKV